ncbi:hypothetical protein RKLH11_3466 [Rhodobacteraceae bacterium KLH11]|nr:hypothetical protein RKLH11_3466 [Rhodobacteraceae bacterium KLH11]
MTAVSFRAVASIQEPGLFYDAVNGSTDALNLLLDAGVDPRVDHGIGLTGLHVFSRNDGVSGLKALLVAGADTNAQFPDVGWASRPACYDEALGLIDETRNAERAAQ